MKIQTSMLVSQMAGSLNGSSVRRSRYGLVLQQKASGLQSNTNALGVRRSVFASIAYAWNLLDPLDKEQWQLYSNANPQTDRFGNPIILSGYAYFMKIQNLLNSAGLPMVNTPDYDSRVNVITNLTVTQMGSDRFQATATLDGNAYSQRAVFFAVKVPRGSSSPFLNYKQFKIERNVGSNSVVENVYISTIQTPIAQEWYIGCFLVTGDGGVSPTVLAKADW